MSMSVSSVSSGSSVSAVFMASIRGESVATLEAQVAAKRAEVASATDPDQKSELQSELAALEAALAAAKAQDSAGADKSGAQAQGQSDPYSQSGSSFSGESGRIGTVNFNDDTPFGQRIAYM